MVSVMDKHAAPTRTHLSPKQVAARLDVDARLVRAWCRSGELPALALSGRPGARRPTYRIAITDLEAFLQARLVPSAVKMVRRSADSW